MADLKAVGLRTDGLKAELQSRLDKHRKMLCQPPQAVPKRFLDDPTAGKLIGTTLSRVLPAVSDIVNGLRGQRDKCCLEVFGTVIGLSSCGNESFFFWGTKGHSNSRS